MSLLEQDPSFQKTFSRIVERSLYIKKKLKKKKKKKKSYFSYSWGRESKISKRCFLFHDIFISKLLKYHHVADVPSSIIYLTTVLENC